MPNGQKTPTQRITETVALFAALGAVLTFLWATGDATGYRPIIKKEFEPVAGQLSETRERLLRTRLELLLEKKARNGDVWVGDDHQEACQIAREIQYEFRIRGCNVRRNWTAR